jgi:hypothetical protein
MHVEALGMPEKPSLDGKPWIGHLPVFLRAFAGAPAREDLAGRLAGLLEEQRKDAVASLRKYYAAAGKGKAPDAFVAGTSAIESGYLWYECWDNGVRQNLRAWRKDAKALKLPKAALQAFDKVFDDFEKAIASGWKAFEGVNRKGRPGG